MTGYIGKVTNQPRDITGQQTQSEREAMFGEINGEVKSFDASTQTASIQPLHVRMQYDGSELEYPVIEQVPVRFARAGYGAMTWPVQVGDKVVLRPMTRSSESYHVDGKLDPSDARSFSLSDMEAHLDGGESLQEPIKNFDAANSHLRFDPDGDYGLRGSKDGKVALEGSEGNIYLLLARAVEIIAEHETMVTLGSSVGEYSHTLAGEAADIAAKLRAMAL